MVHIRHIIPDCAIGVRHVFAMNGCEETGSFKRDVLGSEPVSVTCQHELLDLDAVKVVNLALITPEQGFGPSMLEARLFLQATQRAQDLANVPVILGTTKPGRPSPVEQELSAPGVHVLPGQPYRAVDVLSSVGTCLHSVQSRGRPLTED